MEIENKEEGKNLFSSEFWYRLNTSLFTVGDKSCRKSVLLFCVPAHQLLYL